MFAYFFFTCCFFVVLSDRNKGVTCIIHLFPLVGGTRGTSSPFLSPFSQSQEIFCGPLYYSPVPLALQERRWHNSYLKSPGIKPRNKGMVPNPLPGIFLQSERGPKLAEGAEGDDTMTSSTPNTPSSPSQPQHQPPHISVDQSIFATVELGTGSKWIWLSWFFGLA